MAMPCMMRQSTLAPPADAVSLRVANVRRAAEVYERIGFRYVTAVPDDDGEWVLCLLAYGNVSVLLAPVDHPLFPASATTSSDVSKIDA